MPEAYINGIYKVVEAPEYQEQNAYLTAIRIEDLKQQLSETDYKIIKCAEYQLAGLAMLYDIALLHEERQKIRDQINTLEGGI